MTRSVVQLGGQALKLDADGDTTIQVSSDDVLIISTGGTERLKIDANGHITNPTQCAFLVENSDNQTNITNATIELATERFDLNGDFNNSTDTFTAPVTGKYQISSSIMLANLPNDSNYAYAQLNFSNLNTEIYFDPATMDEASEGGHNISHSILMDMDANDTLQLKFYQHGGTAAADILGTSSQLTTYLSGHLVA